MHISRFSSHQPTRGACCALSGLTSPATHPSPRHSTYVLKCNIPNCPVAALTAALYSSAPTVVVYSPKKGRYSHLLGAYSEVWLTGLLPAS